MPDHPEKKKNLPILLLILVLIVLGGAFLFRAIFSDRDCECGGTADYKNLGYDPMAIRTDPSPILKDTPFKILWRMCYEEDSCDVEGAGMSGEFSEMLVIKGEDPDAPNILTESIPRTPMAAGTCEDRVYEHPGVSEDLIHISIDWRSATSTADKDCEGDRDVDVSANNAIADQLEVICACEEQEFYDIKVAVGPIYDVSDRRLDWTVYFDYRPCDAGPEERVIEEEFTLTRLSTGEVVDTRNEPFTLMMGDSAYRRYELTDWVVGERYRAKVTLGGPDCGPGRTGLDLNNGGLLEFTVEF